MYFGAPTSISCHFIYSSVFCHRAKINGNKGVDTSEGNRPRGKDNGVDFGRVLGFFNRFLPSLGLERGKSRSLRGGWRREGRGWGKLSHFLPFFPHPNPDLPVTCRSGSGGDVGRAAHPPPRPFIFQKKAPFPPKNVGTYTWGADEPGPADILGDKS